jgi:hypothetical protein
MKNIKKNFSLKSIIVGAGLSIAFLGTPAVSQASGMQNLSCVPYNSQWQLCTYLSFNPGSGQWETKTIFMPYQGQWDTIE